MRFGVDVFANIASNEAKKLTYVMRCSTRKVKLNLASIADVFQNFQ